MKLKKLTSRTLLVTIVAFTVSCNTQQKNDTSLKLFYNQPASEWTEALPVGNGFLGAMVYGTVEKEHIQFNEETLWRGKPHDYAHKGASAYLEEIRQLLFEGKPDEASKLAAKEFLSIPVRQMAYQPFGDLYVDFKGHENFTDYYRELDLTNAVCKTSYRVDGVEFKREIIASNPDKAIVIELSSQKKESINCIIFYDALHETKSVDFSDNTLFLEVQVEDGALRGIAGARVDTDGKINYSNGKLSITGADQVTVYLSAATNFKNFKDVSNDPESVLKNRLAGSLNKKYKEIRKEHIEDYQSLFNRFAIDFGSNGRDTLPTDERLRLYPKSNDDPSLVALYMQYGRYLLISSSREGTQPANLQGIWNDKIKPPWESKYTTNINAEMNYWPSELLNLSECHEPFLKLIEECALTGRSIAREHYNCDGWVLHHNTDLWRGAAPINSAPYGVWPTGAAWVCTHLWEHFLFTRDTMFLRERAYPVMKDAALFYSQFLIEDPKTGWLISSPSNSPENGGLVAGPTMDHQLIRSLFRQCVKTAGILGESNEFTSMLAEKAEQVAPNQIGQYGQLQEWLEDKDNPENKHRHVSHLWGVHPGEDITWEKNPELMNAARQSLIFRGDDATGWSLGWKINFWARFLDGDHAYKMFDLLFRPKGGNEVSLTGGGSYLNLFDAHPPFQIDGNFGAAAGVAEMLIQSHQSYIDLLPALPVALNSGSVYGICARGGFELSFNWKDGVLQDVEVLSKAGMKCKLKYKDKTVEFDTEKGKRYYLDGGLADKNRRDDKQMLAKGKPNILFIMSDDHCARAIGAYGSRLADLDPTPNIDKLASEGMIFSNVFCNNSICTPSRASIITGQYPQTNGVLDLYSVLPPERHYLPLEMKKAGYTTAVIGKWHLKHTPQNFDYYCVIPGQGRYYDPIMYTNRDGVKKKVRFDSTLEREVPIREFKGHSSDVITDEVIAWLEQRDRSKPFFLMHHYKAPHDMFVYAKRYGEYLEDVEIPEPDNMYDQPGPYFGSVATRGANDSLVNVIGSSISRRGIRNYGRYYKVGEDVSDREFTHTCYQNYAKDYLRCVKGVDDNFGRLMDYLRDNHLLENTVIIYTGDQGMMLGEHDYMDKRWMYEESMRMPLIIRYPEKIKPGSSCDWLINNTDFAPTILELAGQEVPEYMQGHSFAKALDGRKENSRWRKGTYYRYWMHMAHSHNNPAHFGIRTKKYKLIFFYGCDFTNIHGGKEVTKYGGNRYWVNTPAAWEFYDLEKDPEEMNNRYDDPEYSEIIRDLKKELKKIRKELKETDENYPRIKEIINKNWND